LCILCIAETQFEDPFTGYMKLLKEAEKNVSMCTYRYYDGKSYHE